MIEIQFMPIVAITIPIKRLPIILLSLGEIFKFRNLNVGTSIHKNKISLETLRKLDNVAR